MLMNFTFLQFDTIAHDTYEEIYSKYSLNCGYC